MANAARVGSGAVFQNKHKKEGSNQPDRRGDFTFESDVKAGTKVAMAGWLKKTKDGETYLFLSAQPIQERTDGKKASGAPVPPSKMPAPQAHTTKADSDDRIPFD